MCEERQWVGEWVDGWEKGYAKLPHTQLDWASMQNLPIPVTQQSQIKAKPVAEDANVESVDNQAAAPHPLTHTHFFRPGCCSESAGFDHLSTPPIHVRNKQNFEFLFSR